MGIKNCDLILFTNVLDSGRLMTMMINVIYNKYIGTGGRTQHLHGDDIEFDVYGKILLSSEIILRKRVERSANALACLAVLTALPMAANRNVRSKKDSYVFTPAYAAAA